MLDTAAASARQIATSALGATQVQWSGAARTPMPNELCGVYLPLLTEGFALQLGVLATRDVCATLARALLGSPDDPLDNDEDVFDAVGEITNLIAGNLKVLLTDKVGVRLGVPLAMKGRVFLIGGSQSLYGTLNIDRSDVWLVMTGTKMS
jgi:hypothetical protein